MRAPLFNGASFLTHVRIQNSSDMFLGENADNHTLR